MSYFSVLVELEGEPKRNGAPTKIREMYLVDAMSVTEAEAKTVSKLREEGTNVGFQVTKATETKYLAVI
ncbi:DUF4494 domain-containing protein [bacterium]|jgi:hypothetical protein|nr:DUF4494 domain-containing protein [bacterium]